LQECKDQSKGLFAWERTATEGYQVATALFKHIAAHDGSQMESTVWFPECDNTKLVEALSSILNSNSRRLGEVSAKVSTWPNVPATKIQLTWPPGFELREREKISSQSAVEATQRWVDKTLGRLRLCPHTISMEKAAIGLESSRIKEGPVVIRESLSTYPSQIAAASLAASFWDAITEIATVPEEDLATTLLLAPSSFDDDFVEFAAVCDELIEPTVQATKADSIVGRAWFHPMYDTESIGHTKIVAGHALPASMVEKFVRQIEDDVPDSELIVQANNAVRCSPHATINLLRRSQLIAAKEVEAASPNKKPNSIYARNVLRILSDDSQ